MAAGTDHVVVGLEKMSKQIQEEKLIKHEIECKSWFLNKIKKVYWNGKSPYKVPFKFSNAGNISAAACLPKEIWKGKYELGECTKLGRISGTLCVDEEHLRCYRRIDKHSYIDLIGTDLSDLSERMVKYVDNMLINDGTIARVTSNTTDAGIGAAVGTLTAGDAIAAGSLFIDPSSIDEFQCGHCFEICSENLPVAVGPLYVSEVNTEHYYVIFQTNTIDGVTPPVYPTLAGFDVATDTVKIKPVGLTECEAAGNSFGSIDDCLFKGDTIFGIKRNASPMLRGQVYDISATITPATALADVYKIVYKMMERCLTKDFELLVPYKFFALISQELQHSKDYVQPVNNKGTKHEAGYGYTSICFLSPRGRVSITAVPKMPSDRIWCLDFSSFKWLGDSKTTDPESPSAQPAWYRDRDCGYTYYKDLFFRGKLICLKPQNNSVILLGDSYANC